MEDGIDARLVSLHTVDKVLPEAVHAIGEDAHAVQQVVDQRRLEDVELKLAVHAADGRRDMVAHHLAADHGQGLALRRVHLPGHDRRARLILREQQLGQAATRAGAEVPDILADLEKRGSESVQRPRSLHNRVVGSEDLKLVGGGLELGAGHLGDLGRDGLIEALEGVQASADSSATLGQVAEVRHCVLDALNVAVELGDIAGELLAERQGSRILEMGAADLDELVEFLHLDLESVAQALQGRQQAVLKVQDSCDMHDSREGIVRRGRHVDVVVRVDRLLGAHSSAHDLDRTVRDDLVGVHVGLGAGASLPDNKREVVHELAFRNLRRSLLDGLANLRVYRPLAFHRTAHRKQLTKAIFHVDRSSSTLQDTECLDDTGRHAILGLVDVEVAQGAVPYPSASCSLYRSRNDPA
jgi:hypothetical protein